MSGFVLGKKLAKYKSVSISRFIQPVFSRILSTVFSWIKVSALAGLFNLFFQEFCLPSLIERKKKKIGFLNRLLMFIKSEKTLELFSYLQFSFPLKIYIYIYIYGGECKMRLGRSFAKMNSFTFSILFKIRVNRKKRRNRFF